MQQHHIFGTDGVRGRVGKPPMTPQVVMQLAQAYGSLLVEQVHALQAERDSLKSRLMAARARIDALLDRLPAEPVAAATPAVARKTDAA